MKKNQLASLVFFVVGLALWTPLPYLAGIFHALALACALEGDDDDEGTYIPVKPATERQS